MRGRLINPFLAKIARLDTVATKADPDGAGPFTSGFDDIFREPVKLSDGTSARKEHPVQLIPCQVEIGTYDALHQAAGGTDPDGQMTLVFFFADLEELDLVDTTTGIAKLHVNDRLISIHHYDDETLVQLAGTDGYFCTEAAPQSFGLNAADRNLLICTYKTRDASLKNSGVSA